MKKREMVDLIRQGKFNHKRKIMPIKKYDSYNREIVPFKHQVAAFLIGILLDKCAFLMEQGTGKTLPMIAVLGHRYLKGQIKRALIICPVTVGSELELQFNEYANYPYRLEVLIGNTKLRNKTLTEWKDTDGLQIIIVNYEATWSKLKNGRNGACPEILRWKPDIIVTDESQKLKNGNSTQTRAVCKIAKRGFPYKMIMSGTPIDKPLDFFGQYKFLDQCIFGTSFTAHKDQYARMGGYREHNIIGFKNENELARKVHSISYRVKKADCLDLPKVSEYTVPVELEPSAKAMYKEFHKESAMELMGHIIVAPLAVTRDMKLAQMAGGFLKYNKEDGSTTITQISKAKINATIEKVQSLLETPQRKIVIFAKFTAEVDEIYTQLRKLKINTSRLSGKVKPLDRKQIIINFQNPKSKNRVMVIQISTGGVGITLTAADTEIFYSRDFSNIVYEQAKARVDRIGQTRKVTIIHIVARGTIDTKVSRALILKQNVTKILVDDFYNEFLGGTKMKRCKQEPFEIELSIRTIKLKFSQDILKDGGSHSDVIPGEVNDLETLLIEMERELGVAPMNRINLWNDKKDEVKKSPKSKRDKTLAVVNKVEHKEKKERKIIELTGDTIPLKQLAELMGADAKKMRMWFRKVGLETKSGKWEWEANDPQLKQIQTDFPG